jgi:hypothetical protein
MPFDPYGVSPDRTLATAQGECPIQGFESDGLVDRVAAVHASPASRLGTTCDYEECQ